MKFTSTASLLALGAAAAATTASAQTTPLQLLQTLESLLSPNCSAAISSLSNSSIVQCLNLPGLLPILENNSTSVIPNIDDYLTTLCASSGCSDAVIANTTAVIVGGCAQDLAYFGISEGLVETIMEAIPTAAEVACLSTNSTGNSTLCPISLLTDLEVYLGANFTNTYIDTLLLGGNSTAYNEILDIVYNTTLIEDFACTDCVAAGVSVVLENYPQLENFTFSVPNSIPAAIQSGMGLNVTSTYNVTGSMNWTIPTLYESICPFDVGYNATLPPNITETLSNMTMFNVSMPLLNSTATLLPTANLTARGIVFKREY